MNIYKIDFTSELHSDQELKERYLEKGYVFIGGYSEEDARSNFHKSWMGFEIEIASVKAVFNAVN